jgi:hypothetical protein
LPAGQSRGGFDAWSSRRSPGFSTISARAYMSKSFVEDGDPLDHPLGSEAVGDEHLAEDLVQQARHALDRAEVEHVGVLVKDERLDPVAVVVQLGKRARRNCVQPDLVAEKGGGHSIGCVGVVREDDLSLAGRIVLQDRREREMGRFGGPGRSLGEPLFPFVEMELKMRSFERPPAVCWIGGGELSLRGARTEEQRAQKGGIEMGEPAAHFGATAT